MLSDRYRRFRVAALAMGGLLLVASAFLIAGCASEVRKLPISYVPQQNVQAINGADAVPVEVKVEDLQPETFNHFNPLNPADTAPNILHFLVKDAAETIKQAAETELKARGFKIATAGALITIEVVHFEADYTTESYEFTTTPRTARANLLMQVQVQPQTGKVLYSREVGGEVIPTRGFFCPASGDTEASRIACGRVQAIVRRSRVYGRDFCDASAATRKARQPRPYRRRLRHYVARLIPCLPPPRLGWR